MTFVQAEASTALTDDQDRLELEGAASAAVVATAGVGDDAQKVEYVVLAPNVARSRAWRTLLLAAATSACLTGTAPATLTRRREDTNETSVQEEIADELNVLINRLSQALWGARDENFEDGMDGRLWRWLNEHATQPSAMAEALAALLSSQKTPAEPSALVLRWLAEVRDRESRALTLWLCQRSLFSASPTLRDGAVVALQNLGDPRATTALSEAAARETIALLQSEMIAAVRELTKDHAVPAP